MAKFFSRDRTTDHLDKIDTVIGPDTMFQGILLLKSTVTVEGFFKGKIESKGSVIVGRNGIVEADIVADHVVVNGEVKGNISVYKQLHIGESGKVRGDVEARQVIISKGGILDGFCHMITDKEGELSHPAITEGSSESPEIMDTSELDEITGEDIIVQSDSEKAED